MNFESCGVLPRVLNDLAAAKTELATSGAVIFEPIDCTEAGTRAFAQELFMPDIACLRVCSVDVIGMLGEHLPDLRCVL